MRIIGVSGLAGAGKSLVSEVAAERGSIIFSMGDIIRKEAEKRGEPSKETAKNLRIEHGPYIVAELTIEEIKRIIAEGFDSHIIVEGIRSQDEVELFKEHFDNFIIVSIFANPKLRFERIKLRQREDDTTDYKVFAERDQNELGFGIGNVVSLSDKMIINESDIESCKKEIAKFLEECNI